MKTVAFTNAELDTFKSMFSKYCKNEIVNGRCKDGDCSFCVVNKAYDEMFDPDRLVNLVLEIDELVEFSENKIIVSKDIFDDFEQDTSIVIRFEETDEIYEYVMVSENEDCIVMELLE